MVAKGMKTTEDDSESDLLDSEISKEDNALLVSKKKFSRYRNKYIQGGNSSSKRLDMRVSRTHKMMERKMRKRFWVIQAMNAITVMAKTTLQRNAC